MRQQGIRRGFAWISPNLTGMSLRTTATRQMKKRMPVTTTITISRIRSNRERTIVGVSQSRRCRARMTAVLDRSKSDRARMTVVLSQSRRSKVRKTAVISPSRRHPNRSRTRAMLGRSRRSRRSSLSRGPAARGSVRPRRIANRRLESARWISTPAPRWTSRLPPGEIRMTSQAWRRLSLVRRLSR